MPSWSPQIPLAWLRCFAYAAVRMASFSFVPRRLIACVAPYSSMRCAKWRSNAGCDACGRVTWMRWPNVCIPCCSQNTILKVRWRRTRGKKIAYGEHFLELVCNSRSAGLYSISFPSATLAQRQAKWTYCLYTCLYKVCGITVVINASGIEAGACSLPPEAWYQRQSGNHGGTVDRWRWKGHSKHPHVPLYGKNLKAWLWLTCHWKYIE